MKYTEKYVEKVIKERDEMKPIIEAIDRLISEPDTFHGQTRHISIYALRHIVERIREDSYMRR